ncbi:MAG: sulfite exporter TauE/SafE family protein [Saprospiraceae bacterium]|nr:sulfite exporter TauE/SafE family protein [Saprospiraceae bacterium]
MLLPMMLAAFLYASVGHGGASSYIALMTLFGYFTEEIRTTALLLNIMVSGLSFYQFNQSCVFPTQLFGRLILFSVPAAFMGGMIDLEVLWYKRILGFVLIFAALRLVLSFGHLKPKWSIAPSWWWIGGAGAGIGLLSGMIGIGGGILLSPLVLILGWGSLKETSALSALFILVNSIAGLLGSAENLPLLSSELWIILPCVGFTGLLGAYYGAQHFKLTTLRYLLAAVLLIASVKFILG